MFEASLFAAEETPRRPRARGRRTVLGAGHPGEVVEGELARTVLAVLVREPVNLVLLGWRASDCLAATADVPHSQ